MTILALESSCDETAAAILTVKRGKPMLLSSVVASQIEIHAQYGGVVPEVAARHHVERVLPVITEALAIAKIKPKQINLLAVTAGPGLITSLRVGVETARALSVAWQIPLLAVNHMYGHITGALANNSIKFPALALIVSGGHTEIIYMKNATSCRKVGATVDDAVGEAYDKVAKILGLGYPGGPIISQLATQGNPKAYEFPRPMAKSSDLKFSYSGLKTAVLYQSQKVNLKDKNIVADLCASFQEAALDVLVTKMKRAAKEYKPKTLIVAGGVAANNQLREKLQLLATELELPLLAPDKSLCTDNAGMIAYAAYYLTQKKRPKVDNWKHVEADPNWELEV
jgi:N6-L-threonylcarbamoyladenine synthase